MKKSAIGILGAALILTMGTAGTLCAETVQSGTVPQRVVQQSVTRQSTVQSDAQSAEQIRAGHNNICNYAGTFHDYGNCTGDCRNYIDENQNGVCDNYEAGGHHAWKKRSTQDTQGTQDTQSAQNTQGTQDTQSTQDTSNISSAQYTYGYGGHHGEVGGHHGSGSGSGRHGGCRR